MRLVIVIAALVSVVGCSPQAEKEQYSGQVLFFHVQTHTGHEAEETSEVEADLEHVIKGVATYLDKSRIKHDIKREIPFILGSFDGNQISLAKKDLPSTAGYILVKKDGSFVVRKGLGTDVDVMNDVVNYFQIGIGIGK